MVMWISMPIWIDLSASRGVFSPLRLCRADDQIYTFHACIHAPCPLFWRGDAPSMAVCTEFSPKLSVDYLDRGQQHNHLRVRECPRISLGRTCGYLYDTIRSVFCEILLCLVELWKTFFWNWTRSRSKWWGSTTREKWSRTHFSRV